MTKKIPKVKKVSKDKIIENLQKELKRRDEIIDKLKEENQLLLNISVKNAKKRLEQDKSE